MDRLLGSVHIDMSAKGSEIRSLVIISTERTNFFRCGLGSRVEKGKKGKGVVVFETTTLGLTDKATRLQSYALT